MQQISFGILEITRPSFNFAKLRAFPIIVDGQKVGTVKDGTSLTVPLPPGTHEVKSKIDFMKSNTVNFIIEEGKTRRIIIGYKRKVGSKLYALIGLSFLAVIVGVILGNVIFMSIGFTGIMMTQMGDLYLEVESGT